MNLKQLKIIHPRAVVNFWNHVTRISTTPFYKYFVYVPAYLRGGKGKCPPPSVVLLSINSVCNMRCMMCDVGRKIDKETTFYKNSIPEGAPQISLEKMKDIIDQLAPFRPFLAINSLEPFLYNDLFKAVEYAVENGLEVQITTNGALLYKRAYEAVDSGVHRLMVSLDGPPETHDAIRGMPGLFDKIVGGMRKIQEIKKERGLKYPLFQLSVTVSNHNQSNLSEMIDHLEGMEIHYILIAHLNYIDKPMMERHNAVTSPDYHVSPSNFTEEYKDVSPGNLKIQMDELKRKAKLRNIKIFFQPELDEKGLNIFYHKPSVFIERTQCFVPWTACQIRSDGKIIPSTRCFPYILGDLYEQSFREIWTGERAQKFRELMRKKGVLPACARCCNIF
ncbi:MAG TPA: radical SAM protein [bacterium]|nr:radical SAM protein [bacterium]